MWAESSTQLTLIVIPAIHAVVKEFASLQILKQSIGEIRTAQS